MKNIKEIDQAIEGLKAARQQMNMKAPTKPTPAVAVKVVRRSSKRHAPSVLRVAHP